MAYFHQDISKQTPRLATPADAPRLASLINDAFRSEQTGQTWKYDEQEKRVDIVSGPFISALIKDPAHVMLVTVSAANAQTAVSCCYLRKPSEPPQAYRTAGAAWLGLLAVSPACQNGGLGRAMLDYAEVFTTNEWAVQRLELDTVNTRVGLNAWYERCGYSEFGKRRPFHYGKKGHENFVNGLEVVLLGKDLAHVTLEHNTSMKQGIGRDVNRNEELAL